MPVIGIIPARYESTRFPGKPLVDIKGKTMIQRTWEQARKAIDNVVIATDDRRIADAAVAFGAEAVMTSGLHRSGTERCAEAEEILSAKTGKSYDIVINIQGDEPFIQPEQIKLLTGCFDEPEAGIATLMKRIGSPDDLFNPDLPKVVTDKRGYAIYFSRSAIPYFRGSDRERWHDSHLFFRHIGMYGYRTVILREIARLEPTPLEIAESLEQNRWLENGYRIRVKETLIDTISIDTPEDLKKLT